MKTKSIPYIIAAALLSIISIAKAETYQATGPVTSVTDSQIVITKGKENWVINRSAATKTTGTPKVGDKVTISYSMNAESIEVKSATKTEEKKTDKKPADTKDKKEPAKKAA